MKFFIELITFFWKRKKYWLFPIVIILLTFGFFIVFLGQGSVFSPFIYTIF